MTWARNVSRGFNKFNLEQLDKDLKTKKVFKSKLKVFLQYLKIANDCKRMFKRGLKRSDYPDNLEYSKLMNMRIVLAKKIINKYKKERANGSN
tara:strand:- start:296 stop:574 length:279 start_codon:yes stop_codon:yes gene_type:complete